MCYSKEVQLITALIIILSTTFYYFFYTHKISKFKKGKDWKLSFTKYLAMGFLCIGFHQFFEFLSLVTGEVIIYKLGLIISICSMYFGLKGIEIFLNKRIYAEISSLVIIAISIHIFFLPMSFTGASFYLVHYSAFIWTLFYVVLFIYGNICGFQEYMESKSRKVKRMILLSALLTADIAFILSIGYVVIGYLFFSMNFCTDFASIWCTFHAIQVLLLPFFFTLLLKFKHPYHTKNTLKKSLFYLIGTLIFTAFLVFTLPLFECFTWKFVFP